MSEYNAQAARCVRGAANILSGGGLYCRKACSPGQLLGLSLTRTSRGSLPAQEARDRVGSAWHLLGTPLVKENGEHSCDVGARGGASRYRAWL